MNRLFTCLVFLFILQQAANAACPAPPNTNVTGGKTGEIVFSSGAGKFVKLLYCDGSAWQEFTGSPTATACTKEGEIKNISGEFQYCNTGFLWAFDSTGGTNGACPKNGEIKFNTGTSRLEFCKAGSWRTISDSDSTADPFSFVNFAAAGFDTVMVDIRRITGFAGGTGTFTFNTSSCINFSARTCADSGCSTILSTRTTDGTLSIPNGAYLRLGFISASTGSANCSITANIGGQSSALSVTTAATDTTVTYTSSFNEVRSASPGVLYTSNIVKTTSHGDVTLSISDNGFGGSPEFRTCADAACSTVVQNWGSASQTLSNNEYVQLRITAGSGTTSLRRVSVSAGTGGSAFWNVMTSTCPRTTTLASGASLTCTCPVNYHIVQTGVTGTGNYRQTSDVCAAGLHNGAYTTGAGGTVTVRGNTSGTPAGTCPSFTGSIMNGVTSSSAGSDTSMFFPPATDACN